jgi:alanine racemase
VVYDPKDLELFSEAARARRRTVDIHVKIDTGMSRLGIEPAAVSAVLDRVERLGGLRVAGLCTHFACADVPTADDTERALSIFNRCVAETVARGLVPLTNHAANSAAAVRFPGTRLDAVRPGLAIYGALSSPSVILAGLEPALRLSTRIMAIRRVPVGTTVSYGGLWRAARPSLVATLPVGYADGYPKHVRGAETLVRGRRAPVVGAVCMDMMMIDVTDIPGATVDDAVTLIGDEQGGPQIGQQDGAGAITVDEVASWAGTINYEILSGISKRVPRVYKD